MATRDTNIQNQVIQSTLNQHLKLSGKCAGLHSGFSAIYLLISLVALLGFASLAVDYARVQMARTKILYAADAAARAAAMQIPNGVDAVQSAAMAIAGSNDADGTNIIVDPKTDIEIGTWDASARKFAVSDFNQNAVRITVNRTAARSTGIKLFFAGIFGSGTCDTKASAIAVFSAAANSQPKYVKAFVGISSVNLDNGTSIDSLNSRNNGSVMSSGSINIGSGTIVTKYAYLQNGAKLNNAGKLAYGYTTYNPDPNFPATESAPDGAINLGNFVVARKTTSTLKPGIYSVYDLTLEEYSELQFSGESTIYVLNSITMASNSKLYSTETGTPAKSVQIKLIGKAQVNVSDHAWISAYCYGPSSVVALGESTQWDGWIVSRTLNVASNGVLNLGQFVVDNDGADTSTGSCPAGEMACPKGNMSMMMKEDTGTEKNTKPNTNGTVISVK